MTPSTVTAPHDPTCPGKLTVEGDEVRIPRDGVVLTEEYVWCDTCAYRSLTTGARRL